MKNPCIKLAYLLVILLLFSWSVRSQSSKQSIPEEETQNIISMLAADSMQGREPGTEGFDKVTRAVTSFLQKNNIKPFFATGYLDTCKVRQKLSSNIVAIVGDRKNQKTNILISAHLDHLGMLAGRKDSVFNGANDNASGVTAVLEIAKELNKSQHKKNIIIALFTGEEEGLIGSEHLAQRMKDEGVPLEYMINFEMIGKTLSSGANQVYMTGFDKSDFAKKVNDILHFEFVRYLPLAKTYGLFERSDNYSFYQTFGIPAHTLCTFDFQNYEYYHKLGDEVQQLDLANMNLVINTSYVFIRELVDKDVKINITSTAD